MTTGTVLGTSLLATLAHPATWVLALAGFLVRGGILFFLLPIVVVPSPVGLGNALGPSIVAFVLGGATLGFIATIVGGIGIVLVWLIGGGFLAAAIEVELVGIVVDDEDVAAVGSASVQSVGTARLAVRVLAARLLAFGPLLAALVWGATRVITVTYAELTLPSDVTTPIAWRVVLAVPDAVAVLAIAWIGGEIVGARAARRLVLRESRLSSGLGGALRDTLRHPLRTALVWLIPTVGLVLILVPSMAAATVAWALVRTTLDGRSGPLVLAASLIGFVALWAGGLALAGAACAWRAAAWTVDAAEPGPRTFGASPDDHAGDRRAPDPSATVSARS